MNLYSPAVALDFFKTAGKPEKVPQGVTLFAENQKSNNIVVFRIDGATGKLSPTGDKLEVGAPVCIKFVAMK